MSSKIKIQKMLCTQNKLVFQAVTSATYSEFPAERMVIPFAKAMLQQFENLAADPSQAPELAQQNNITTVDQAADFVKDMV